LLRRVHVIQFLFLFLFWFSHLRHVRNADHRARFSHPDEAAAAPKPKEAKKPAPAKSTATPAPKPTKAKATTEAKKKAAPSSGSFLQPTPESGHRRNY
jgi:biotin carboxyl carrier protein